MLPKVYQLKKDRDFQNVFKKGQSLFSPFLFLKFLSNNLSHSRFGFIVSPEISKKAVERNKIKRRLREIIREKIDKIPKSYDFVVIARKGIEQKNFEELKNILGEILNKL